MREERIAEIYEAIETLVVELDKDPGSRGPGYLQDLISKTRGFLNRTSAYQTEVFREVHEEEMNLEALEAAFSVASDDLMANDRQVSTLPAIQDRVAMVNVLLASQRREILAKKRVLKNLSHVDRVVRHRHKELENTMSAIRLQRSLLETELRTGSFYGDENEQSRGTRWANTPAKQDDIDVNDIERLLTETAAESFAEVPTTAPKILEPTRSSPVQDDEEDDDAIRRFLKREEDDDADLFKNL